MAPKSEPSKPRPSIVKTILTVLGKVKPADYTISTWLTLGATLQCILIFLLPRNIALLPPVLFLLYRLVRGYLVATNRLPNPLKDGVALKRTTWQIPESADGSPAETPSSESIVVLVLAATWSHPNGSFSPGSKQLGEYFAAMWADANAQRDKYGYLGNTPTMTSQDDGGRPDAAGKTLLYLSYWKTLEGLHKFAHGSVHMKGQMWWDNGAMNKYNHIGMMHEVYEVPKGNWENVFHNFRPFAITNAEYPVTVQEKTAEGVKEEVKWVNGTRDVVGREWKDMHSRMGRKQFFGGLKTPV